MNGNTAYRKIRPSLYQGNTISIPSPLWLYLFKPQLERKKAEKTWRWY